MSNITLPNGYKMTTTFFEDFQIADAYGKDAIKDTFNRSFKAYKDNHIYMTELAIVLSNESCWWYSKDNEISLLYAELYRLVDEYAQIHFNKEQLNFYYSATD